MDIRPKTADIVARIRGSGEPQPSIEPVWRWTPGSESGPLRRSLASVRFAGFGPITYTFHQQSDGKGEAVPDQFDHKLLCSGDSEERGHEILVRHELLARAGYEILTQDTKNWRWTPLLRVQLRTWSTAAARGISAYSPLRYR